MRGWKKLLMNAYYCGTAPYRSHLARRAAAAARAPISMVLYHRIADDSANEWTTSTDAFLDGIRWLQARFELVSLAEAQRRIRSGANSRPCVSITFDDGYAVNCLRALPLLIAEKIPCTYFVSTGPVLDGVPFEHDLQMGNRFAPNTVGELQALARAGIEIGGHSRTHADLGQIDEGERLYDELVASRNDLQDAVGQPIRYFAFPFGQHRNLSKAAFQLAKESGFEAVCSAYGGYNFPGDDAFHLQRRGVDGPLLRLKNWVTVDPLRNRNISRFEYEPALSPRVATATGAGS